MNTTNRSMGETKAFEWPVRIYWEDTDAGGIVFYANYLKFFERARTEWLRSIGFGQHGMREQTGGMFVVTGADLRYHRPARLDDELIVTAAVSETGRASLTIEQKALLKSAQMNQATSPVLLCEASIRIGWVDAATMRPSRIPGPLLEQLSS
ncbi:tol-pal system-associated acyl-CoA thioesterase [Diaphorobacter caeni]|uniref:tol-pal system-associated acyl-CoA thioesterase n=1 Tax=Diaphorobacter caeni TaxID=2784387 RepID=UPI001E3CDD70|nr:tol-pal system-associated acyl-CoA thioesterase [Diaphorobacter caeni]